MTKFFERQSSAIYSKLQLLNPQGVNVVRSKLKKTDHSTNISQAS